jgi:hypothetical protein
LALLSDTALLVARRLSPMRHTRISRMRRKRGPIAVLYSFLRLAMRGRNNKKSHIF